MFFMLSWDIFYYIIIKQGNNKNIYFIFKRYRKCLIHNSYRCGCIPEERQPKHTSIIQKFILFYKYCSMPLELKNKRISNISIDYIINLLNK